MSPEQYFSDCCNPGDPVGYTFCKIDQDAKENGWTLDQVLGLKQTVEKRYREGNKFPFPKVVRYV
jgi:hypothetical protein